MEQIGLFDAQQREEFTKRLLAGEHLDCPCCRRHARVWRLRIHATLAMMLVRLYRESLDINRKPDGWVHIESFKPTTTTGNDFSIVKHWGLAVPMPAAEHEDKNSSGRWALTELGVAWVRNRATVRKYANVFNDKMIDLAGDELGILDALGKKFSYAELLA